MKLIRIEMQGFQSFVERTVLEFDQAITAIDPPSLLIDHQDEINDLSQRLGSYKKAMLDYPRRRADFKRLQDEAFIILKKLGKGLSLEAAGSIRLTEPEATRIRELGREHRTLRERERSLKTRLSEIDAELKHIASEIQRLPVGLPIGPLEAELKDLAKWGDLNEAVKIMAKYQEGLEITDQEADLIVKFLNTLTGEYKGELLQ